MNPKTIGPAITEAGFGRRLKAFGEEVILHLEGGQTGGSMDVWTEITPPGGGPPPHYHTREDEWFYVLEGELSFLVEGEWRSVSAGGAVFAPRNSVHAFKNIGPKPSQMVIGTTPSGFGKFFARCDEEFAKPGGPSMERVMEISAEHGIHFVMQQA